MRRVWITLAVAIAAVALAAPAAGAHALVTGTSPARGASLKAAPSKVEFDFSESVETNFGSLRVFDSTGKRVDRGDAGHPGGAASRLAIGLESGLPDGTFTATYRVISADSHPVSGGFTFSVGKAGPAPTKDVADLLKKGSSTGAVTEVAFGAARALGYVAIALLGGGLVFLLAIWGPGLSSVARGGSEWDDARAAFTQAAWRIGAVAVVLGIGSTVAGIVLQGATAGATDFWQALDPQVIRDVLGTRFGTFWGLRFAAWVAVAIVLLASRRTAPGRLRGIVLAFAAALLVTTPALAGHASTQGSPRGVLVGAALVHVAAMSVWVGGLVALIAALPAATRRLAPPDRTRLLAASIDRFSPVALGMVAALVATGVLQSVLYLDAWSELTSTPFGRAILVKVALLTLLVGLGAHNRQRSKPRLDALAAAGEPTGGAGLALRRALRAEVVLVVVVLGVTAALASYSPTVAASSGPFSAQRDIGPLELQMTVDPAVAGRNEIHLYLFNRKDGSQFDRVREFDLEAALPGRKIGPLPLDPRKSGPGHYTVPAANLAPGGDWRLRATVRVSAFDEYVTTVKVPIR